MRGWARYPASTSSQRDLLLFKEKILRLICSGTTARSSNGPINRILKLFYRFLCLSNERKFQENKCNWLLSFLEFIALMRRSMSDKRWTDMRTPRYWWFSHINIIDRWWWCIPTMSNRFPRQPYMRQQN